MSVRSRSLLAVVTVLLWAGWIACLIVAHESPRDADMDFWQDLCGQVLRMAAFVSAVSLVLGCLVTPMSVAIRVGREIGRAERRRECSCDRSEGYAQVLPFKPGCQK